MDETGITKLRFFGGSVPEKFGYVFRIWVYNIYYKLIIVIYIIFL